MIGYIERALLKKYGVHGFYIMNGAFSEVRKNMDPEGDRSIIPLNFIVKEKDKDLNIGFSVGASGSILPDADEIRIIFHLMDLDTAESEVILEAPVPKVVVSETGFSASANLHIPVSNNSQLLMVIEVNITEPETLEYVNRFANDEDEKLIDVLSLSLVAARLNVFIKDELENE
ncbi:hypothetical protein [Exiguobacterium sp. s7]|uniref:hypothetical protein n=1 Tax=Exiguobacterium sp. s7 TaxID=2751235 RepID=UPI001BED269D|nr:hypothetical protein [Exiguobacterium sp. s7]